MNIVYVTNIVPVPWAGPTYSVPAQIAAQSKYDAVLWVNLLDSSKEEWKQYFDRANWNKLPYYVAISPKEFELQKLTKPFCNPDLIIIEQFYCMAKTGIIKQLKNSNIPYIIIPRGEMTRGAQKKKKGKKIIANIVLFHSFAKKASAIQYLTEQERIDSGIQWNKNQMIVPNGTELPKITKKNFCGDGYVRCIMIGRLDPFHKGLDLLIGANIKVKEQVSSNACRFDIYGPDRLNKKSEMIELIHENSLDSMVSIHDALYGEDKQHKLLSSDVFVITSRFEGHPMSLIEAMSYGIPCIATTGSNMKSEIEKYDAGWTAENTSDSIKNAILMMLSEKDKLQEKGNNARKLAEEYDWGNLAAKSHSLYCQLLDRCRKETECI